LVLLAAVLLVHRVIHEIAFRKRLIPVTPASPPSRTVRTFVRAVDLETREESVIEIQKRHQESLRDGTLLLFLDKSGVAAQRNGQQQELDDQWSLIGGYLLRVISYDERVYDKTM
jgi:hypothetical protein